MQSYRNPRSLAMSVALASVLQQEQARLASDTESPKDKEFQKQRILEALTGGDKHNSKKIYRKLGQWDLSFFEPQNEKRLDKIKEELRKLQNAFNEANLIDARLLIGVRTDSWEEVMNPPKWTLKDFTQVLHTWLSNEVNDYINYHSRQEDKAATRVYIVNKIIEQIDHQRKTK